MAYNHGASSRLPSNEADAFHALMNVCCTTSETSSGSLTIDRATVRIAPPYSLTTALMASGPPATNRATRSSIAQHPRTKVFANPRTEAGSAAYW